MGPIQPPSTPESIPRPKMRLTYQIRTPKNKRYLSYLLSARMWSALMGFGAAILIILGFLSARSDKGVFAVLASGDTSVECCLSPNKISFAIEREQSHYIRRPRKPLVIPRPVFHTFFLPVSQVDDEYDYDGIANYFELSKSKFWGLTIQSRDPVEMTGGAFTTLSNPCLRTVSCSSWAVICVIMIVGFLFWTPSALRFRTNRKGKSKAQCKKTRSLIMRLYFDGRNEGEANL